MFRRIRPGWRQTRDENERRRQKKLAKAQRRRARELAAQQYAWAAGDAADGEGIVQEVTDTVVDEEYQRGDQQEWAGDNSNYTASNEQYYDTATSAQHSQAYDTGQAHAEASDWPAAEYEDQNQWNTDAAEQGQTWADGDPPYNAYSESAYPADQVMTDGDPAYNAYSESVYPADEGYAAFGDATGDGYESWTDPANQESAASANSAVPMLDLNFAAGQQQHHNQPYSTAEEGQGYQAASVENESGAFEAAAEFEVEDGFYS